jgi:acetyl/propionyl-CoA carboxylase alpha subunit
MPDIKIVTEVAGRVCAIPIATGSNVGDGDEVAFVEAMKMEIPVTSTAAGKSRRSWSSSTMSSPKDRWSRSSKLNEIAA